MPLDAWTYLLAATAWIVIVAGVHWIVGGGVAMTPRMGDSPVLIDGLALGRVPLHNRHRVHGRHRAG